jgi:hypothetical protein
MSYTPPQAPGQPLPYAPVAANRPMNGMAVASLVLSIIGAVLLCVTWIGGVVGIPGAVVGHVARGQIRARGESGGGIALAGIIVGWIAGGLGVIAGAAIAAYVIWGVGYGTGVFS